MERSANVERHTKANVATNSLDCKKNRNYKSNLLRGDSNGTRPKNLVYRRNWNTQP